MTRTSELVAIGVNDVTPPEGRVTLELRSASTGRLRKRVVVENALMDWYKAAVLRNGGRGRFDTLTSSTWRDYGLNPVWYQQGQGGIVPDEQTLEGWMVPGRWPAVAGVTRLCTNWLWASDANVAPDAGKIHIPLSGIDVTGGVKIDTSAYTADGIQNRRGTPNLALSLDSYDQNRMVVDFASSEGNGTYRSIGIGNLINQKVSPGGLRPYPAQLRITDPSANTVPSAVTLGVFGVRHAAMGQNKKIWTVDASFQLSRISVTAATVLATDFTVVAGNVPGSGGPLGPVVEHTPSDFWVARNQTLFRCVAPVSNAAITPVNTYDLSATLGAEAILDITFDGTNLYLLTLTSVYVVNPATGASTSNWTHGLSGGTLGWQSMVYDSAEELLWINFVDQTSGGVVEWGSPTAGSLIALNSNSLVCYGFGVAGGSPTKSHMGRHVGVNGSSQTPGRQLGAIRSDGHFFGRVGTDGTGGSNAHFLTPHGPSMATHALLGADVEKTAADGLRITYDFDWV